MPYIEHWKLIEDFPNYAVSDLGRVKRTAVGPGTFVGKVLKPSVHQQGYLQVILMRNGVRFCVLVHRLVALAFVPNSDPANFTEVNHTRDDKRDNRARGLEWRSEMGHGQDKARRNQCGDGVHFNKKKGKWYATFRPTPYTAVHLGSFNTQIEARAARTAAIDGVAVRV